VLRAIPARRSLLASDRPEPNHVASISVTTPADQVIRPLRCACRW
jgi:hypothetical protein